MDLKAATDLCTYCPRLCSDRCPVSLAEARETVTPQAKMARLGALSRAPADRAPLDTEARGPLSSLPLYACTGCGACTDSCVHKVEPGRHLMTGRGLVEGRHGGHPALRDLPRRQRARAQAAAEGIVLAVPDEQRRAEAPLGFLPACLEVPGGGPAEEARRFLRLTERAPALAGDGEVAVSTAGCAGYPLYAGGFHEEFRLYAEVFARQVSGHKTLLVSCPGCAWLLRHEYPAHGVPLSPTVLHLSEHLGQHAEALPVRRSLGDALYHDPCHLGRKLGVYEPPRAALARAFDHLGEFAQSRAAAPCCGGGGLVPLTAPETAQAMAEERLAGAPRGAVVVTACPSCQRQLGRGRRALGLLEALDEATA